MCSTVCIQSLNSDVSTFASEIPSKWTNTPLKWKPTGLTKLFLALRATRPTPRPAVQLPAAVAGTAGDALVQRGAPDPLVPAPSHPASLGCSYRGCCSENRQSNWQKKDWRNDSPAQQPPERCRQQRSRVSSVHNSSTSPDTASHLPTHLQQLLCSLY